MLRRLYTAISEYLGENPEILGVLGFIAWCLLGLAFAFLVYN